MALRILMGLVVAGTICSISARAAPVTISGSGRFGPSDSTSSVYQANAAFSFTFVVDSPLVDNPLDLVGAVYSVGGQTVATPIVVDFFSSADGGLFSLGFDDGSSLSLFGRDIGSGGTVASGTFDGAVFGSADEFGSATISVAYAVPLPASFATLGAGLLMFAGSNSLRRTTGREAGRSGIGARRGRRDWAS